MKKNKIKRIGVIYLTLNSQKSDMDSQKSDMDLENFCYIQLSKPDLKRVLAMVEVSTRCMYKGRTRSRISKYSVDKKEPVKLIVHSRNRVPYKVDLSEEAIIDKSQYSTRHRRVPKGKKPDHVSPKEINDDIIKEIPPPSYMYHLQQGSMISHDFSDYPWEGGCKLEYDTRTQDMLNEILSNK